VNLQTKADYLEVDLSRNQCNWYNCKKTGGEQKDPYGVFILGHCSEIQ